MAEEGTCISRLEEAQRAMELRLNRIESSVLECKESLQHLESLLHQLTLSEGMKIEIPHFDGTNAEEWIFKIQNFFEIFSTPMDQRMKIASFHMTGPAYSWYMWIVSNDFIRSWQDFLDALLLRFGSSHSDLIGALKELKQDTTVENYEAKFEEICSKITGLSESWLISFFIAGLESSIRCELLIAQPSSYIQAVKLAKLHERKQQITN